MSTKSAEQFRAEARRVRGLARAARSPALREGLRMIASEYEDLARQVEVLAEMRSRVSRRRDD